MKYLQVFEAFKSSSLNKTLSFLNNDSKSRFKALIKNIGDSLDLPYSLISDDYIEYLPYKKALYKFKEASTKEPDCTATSVAMFKKHGVDGETCKGGMIKRTWGDKTRIVECPNCKGKGKLPINKKELLLVKFWFNSEGKFITTTGVDGTKKAADFKKITYNKIDYKPGKTIGYREARDLPEGTPILFENEHHGSIPVIAVVHYYGASMFFLQNSFFGSTPGDMRSTFKKYGFKGSWSIASDQNIGSVRLLVPITGDEEVDTSVDPFEFNFKISGSLGSQIKNFIGLVLKDSDLGDAHFALVLDLEKLRELKFKSLSKTRTDRKSSREGAYTLLKNEDIKKLNIQRYLSKLSEPSDNIADSKRVILRILGGSKCLFLFRIRESHSLLYNLSDYYTSLLKHVNPDGTITSESNYNMVKRDIKSSVKSWIEETNKVKTKVTNRIDRFKIEIEPDQANQVKLIEKVEALSNHIFQKISSQSIETVDDIEVLYYKLKSLANMFSNSRSPSYKIWEYVIRYATYDEEFKTVMDSERYTGNIDESINYLETRFKPMIDKILN